MSEPETTGNGDWSAWSATWESVGGGGHPATPAASAASAATALAGLRRRAARQRRRQLAIVAGEGVLCLALLALSGVLLRGGAAAWEVVWLGTLWGFVLVAGGFAWWNRRATWRATGAALEDYVRLARLRAERQLRTVRFVLLLYVAEATVVVAQLLWFDRLVPGAVAALAAAGVAIAAWCVLTRRRLRRELARIDAFARELPDPA
jgi:hypothetical protein